jgi:hypothetical protein
MSSEGLVELARRYVACNDELEVLRGELRKAVLNGGGTPEAARPTGAERPGVKGSQSSHSKAAAAEQAIVELLGKEPGLKTGAIAAATGAPAVTVQDRLRRLRRRGAIAGSGTEGWRATSG